MGSAPQADIGHGCPAISGVFPKKVSKSHYFVLETQSSWRPRTIPSQSGRLAAKRTRNTGGSPFPDQHSPGAPRAAVGGLLATWPRFGLGLFRTPEQKLIRFSSSVGNIDLLYSVTAEGLRVTASSRWAPGGSKGRRHPSGPFNHGLSVNTCVSHQYFADYLTVSHFWLNPWVL